MAVTALGFMILDDGNQSKVRNPPLLNLWNLPSFESNTQILTSFLEISIACVYILSNTTLGTTGKLWVPLEVWKLEEKQQNRVFCAGALAQRVSPRQGEVLRSPAEACGILRGPAAACENLRSTGGKLRSTGRKLRSTGGKLRWLAECCGDLRDPAVCCEILRELARELREPARSCGVLRGPAVSCGRLQQDAATFAKSFFFSLGKLSNTLLTLFSSRVEDVLWP
jgi:hypothetical protein